MQSYPLEAKIIEDDCIGCGACVTEAPSLFEINNGVANFTELATDGNIPAEFYDDFLDAYSACPTYAIKFK
jgi:ferredoxin